MQDLSCVFFIFTDNFNKIKWEVCMKKILKELKLIINKELYQKGKITFEEFKLANERVLKEQENEYCKN